MHHPTNKEKASLAQGESLESRKQEGSPPPFGRAEWLQAQPLMRAHWVCQCPGHQAVSLLTRLLSHTTACQPTHSCWVFHHCQITWALNYLHLPLPTTKSSLDSGLWRQQTSPVSVPTIHLHIPMLYELFSGQEWDFPLNITSQNLSMLQGPSDVPPCPSFVLNFSLTLFLFYHGMEVVLTLRCYPC